MSPEPPKKQPLATKALHLLGACVRMAKALVNGETIDATPEEANRRLTICHGCPLLVDGECSLCGCPVASKVKYATEFCDAGKWQAVRGQPSAGIVDGRDIFDHELALREVLPTGKLAEAFNDLHTKLNDKSGRCRNCEKKSLLRALEVALGRDLVIADAATRLQVQAVLPNRTMVQLTAPRKWADIIHLETNDYSVL